MKVLHINATYGIGSTGVITKELAEVCHKNGIQSYIAYPVGHGLMNSNPNVYEIGSKLDRKIHALLSRIAGKQAYFSRCATKKLLRYLDSINPDIVHLHNLHCNYINLNMLLKHLSKRDVATVITFHDCWLYTGGCFHYTSVGCEKWKEMCGNCIKQYDDFPAYLFDRSAQILSDRVRLISSIKHLALIGVSHWVESQLVQSRLKDCGHVGYIYNGYDFDIFTPKNSNKREELSLTDKFVILAPASKWLMPINKSVLEYFSNNLPANAVILLFGYCGESHSLPRNVRVYGFTKNRDEMAELYSMADVMVNCSREDTLSSLNVEAQACGTPVVTFEATGMKETVDNICGFAVQTGNPELLFNKMMFIYNAGKEAFSKACRKFVVEKFEKNSNYNEYIKLYRNLLNERETK